MDTLEALLQRGQQAQEGGVSQVTYRLKGIAVISSWQFLKHEKRTTITGLAECGGGGAHY